MIMPSGAAHSLIIPVYRNAESLPELLIELDQISSLISGTLELIFVVDGSPDASYAILKKALVMRPTPSRLICHSRNFGSFAAIREGLLRATGSYLAVMAADLQDPPSVVLEFFRTLAAEPVDIVVGTRITRDDRLRRNFSLSPIGRCTAGL
jgi:glycosyltransferase involved in cell wall biosynthesis